MNFNLIDRIIELRPGDGIRAAKTLSLAEEYLADHFPGYPVLPGVLMIEAMTQTAAWYLRVHQELRLPVVTLLELKAVKFPRFVTPGETLIIDLELKSIEADGCTADFRANGRVLTPDAQLHPEGWAFESLPLACQARLRVQAASVSSVAPELSPAVAEATEGRMRDQLWRDLATLGRNLAPGALPRRTGRLEVAAR